MKEERPRRQPARKPESPEKKAAEKLSKPPEDKRETTIAPSVGPDVTVE